MALAYPEGECFFLRTALDSASADGHHASNVKDFYSHMMVEFVWNLESDHSATESRGDKGHRHPRSGYKIVKGSLWNTDYGCWTTFPFCYGPQSNKLMRRVEHNLCTNGNRFRDHEKGGALEVSNRSKPSLQSHLPIYLLMLSQAWFMFMPMPTTEERRVWIDVSLHRPGTITTRTPKKPMTDISV